MILKLAIAHHQRMIARRGYRTFVRKCVGDQFPTAPDGFNFSNLQISPFVFLFKVLASENYQPDHIKIILNQLPISTRHTFTNHWKRFSTSHFYNCQNKDGKVEVRNANQPIFNIFIITLASF